MHLSFPCLCPSWHLSLHSVGFPIFAQTMMQEVFVNKVTKMIEHRKEEAVEVLKGWFTPEQMKAELHWSSTLFCIKQIDGS